MATNKRIRDLDRAAVAELDGDFMLAGMSNAGDSRHARLNDIGPWPVLDTEDAATIATVRYAWTDARRFGAATGSGAANADANAIAINRAITNAATIGVRTAHVYEDYNIGTSPIALRSGVILDGHGGGALRQLDVVNAVEATHAIGGRGQSNLASNLALDDVTVTVVSGAVFGEGEMIYLAEAANPNTQYVNRIKSKSGNVLTLMYTAAAPLTTANGAYCSTVDECAHAGIRNMTVTTAGASIGVYAVACQSLLVSRVNVTAGRLGISHALSIDPITEYCHALGSGFSLTDGPSFSGLGIQGGTFLGNRAIDHKNGDEPFNLYKHCQDVDLIGNRSDSSLGAALLIDECRDCRVIGGALRNCGGTVGAYVVNDASGISFLGVEVNGTAQDGFWFTSGSSGSVVGCKETGVSRYSLYVDATAGDVYYSGNVFEHGIQDLRNNLVTNWQDVNAVRFIGHPAIFADEGTAGVFASAGASAGFIQVDVNGTLYKIEVKAVS